MQGSEIGLNKIYYDFNNKEASIKIMKYYHNKNNIAFNEGIVGNDLDEIFSTIYDIVLSLKSKDYLTTNGIAYLIEELSLLSKEDKIDDILTCIQSIVNNKKDDLLLVNFTAPEKTNSVKIETDLILEDNESAILFLDDCNGYKCSNPKAFLVAVLNFNAYKVENAEKSQIEATRMGGKWAKALEDCNMKYRVLSKGDKSDFVDEKFKNFIQYEYQVISGNY